MLTELEVALRLTTALLAGSALGWEREAHHKPAGLKTHMLVALGSAGFMLAGVRLHEQLVAQNQADAADLLKVLAGIVGGIGFLGAGSIMRTGGEVQGLTTAATIWMASAAGIACSLGLYVLAGVAVGLALLTLLVLGVIQRIFFDKGNTPDGLASNTPGNPQNDT
jgi:putative Mg2+ transporter-C (MgtC) family protein